MSIFDKKNRDLPKIPWPFAPKVKVRFAPSPTGFLHIGGLRTALYNYLFAKKNKGKFILRIEDTDAKRKVEGGVENILGTLKACGLKYDEGPDVGGRGGPYIQSERLPIYKKYAEDLIESGYAYYCFCTSEDLEREREKQKKEKIPAKYGGKCIKTSKSEAEKRIKKGEKYVIRLKVPNRGVTEFEDLVYGKIKIKNEMIDHQVLMKSDGFPTYHLANVVDDHLMGITHIIRGEEWLPSTPKHILLYKALGWKLPSFAHLPLLLNPDKSKLSKRQGDVAVEDYIKKGYLPDALLNFVALLGWNPKGDQEIYSLRDFVRYFDLKNVNKGGAVFNLEKLYWMNGEYIKKLPLKELVYLCMPYLKETKLIEDGKIFETGEKLDKKYLEDVIALEQERLKRVDEIPQLTEFFFKETLNYEAVDLVWKKSDKEKTKENLENLLEFLKKLLNTFFVQEKLEAEVKKWIGEKGLDSGSVLWPMRVALSGRRTSPSPFEIAGVLGKEKTIKRIEEGINKL